MTIYNDYFFDISFEIMVSRATSDTPNRNFTHVIARFEPLPES